MKGLLRNEIFELFCLKSSYYYGNVFEGIMFIVLWMFKILYWIISVLDVFDWKM